MDPYRLTACEAVARIQKGALTVEQYVRSLLARIEERDEAVQAWAYLHPEHVLAEARRLDAIPPAERGPLHGVAIGIKDVMYTKDMPTQFNSPIYAGDAPAVDAACVATLRAAGALIFGKTATTEFAATTDGPKTRNAHSPHHTPGGSSSGSGAAVADFQVPLALGTQTGGSTIRPGSFNGIYALKPTWNVISREGAKVYSLLFDTIGLYARSIADLQLLADVLDIEDDELVGSVPFSLAGATFAVVKTVVWPQVGPGTAAALEKGAALLRQHGATVKEIVLPPAFDELPAWHSTWLAAEGRTAFLPLYRSADAGQLSDFLAGHVQNRRQITRAQQTEAFDSMAALRPQMDALASRYAALLTPSVVDEAPVGTALTGSAAFNSIWTALHTPVVNVPGFKGASGLPIGLSLVAPRYRDRHLLRVAKAVGEVFEMEGGWKG